MASYGNQIKIAVQNKFYDWDSYKGRTCTLRINMAPDGLVIGVKVEVAILHFAKQLQRQLGRRKCLNHQVKRFTRHLKMHQLILILGNDFSGGV